MKLDVEIVVNVNHHGMGIVKLYIDDSIHFDSPEMKLENCQIVMNELIKKEIK